VVLISRQNKKITKKNVKKNDKENSSCESEKAYTATFRRNELLHVRLFMEHKFYMLL